MIKRQRVLICIPSYDCTVTVPTCQSLIHAIAVASRDHAINIEFKCGSALIARSRNLLVAEAMSKNYDQIFFIDADVGFSPEALKRFIEHDEEVVAGVYPYRLDERLGQWPVRWAVEPGQPMQIHDNGLIEARRVPAGFLRIKRSAIEKLSDANPDKLVFDPQAPNGQMFSLFGHELANGADVGEDFYFCALWQKTGGKIWVDPDVSFEHVGMKSWRGNLNRTLQEYAEQVEAEKAAA